MSRFHEHALSEGEMPILDLSTCLHLGLTKTQVTVYTSKGFVGLIFLLFGEIFVVGGGGCFGFCCCCCFET